MGSLFTPETDGARITLTDAEVSVLLHYTVQVMDLIGGDDAPAADSTEALVSSAFADGPTKPPDDPVLARFFPDAYGEPGTASNHVTLAASAEFRRYTENDLRSRKRRDALTLIRSLEPLTPNDDGEAELHLTLEQCRGWLGALNDLRLAIGTRVEVTEDHDHDYYLELPEDDPRKPLMMVYLWLSGLQETLIDCLE